MFFIKDKLKETLPDTCKRKAVKVQAMSQMLMYFHKCGSFRSLVMDMRRSFTVVILLYLTV